MLVHRALESAAERDMIGFAVPERTKSASLTELMKESWRIGAESKGRGGGGVVVEPGEDGGDE